MTGIDRSTTAGGPREWLESMPARLPITPPFGGYSYTVQAERSLSRGEGWNLRGVDIVRRHVDRPAEELAVNTMTPEQARALARALHAAADEAELRSLMPRTDRA